VAICIYICDKEEKKSDVMENEQSKINGPQMIDIRLVNGGRRLMNSKENRKQLVFLLFTHLIELLRQ
jgi:hypothetical protein